MALKIIGVGFGRTGTESLYTALNQLGFPCYHMYEVIRNKANKRHLDFWLKVAKDEPGKQHDWEQVFSRYTAAVDNPDRAAYPTNSSGNATIRTQWGTTNAPVPTTSGTSKRPRQRFRGITC